MQRSNNVLPLIFMGIFALCWIVGLWNVVLASRIKRPPGQALPSLPEILGNPDDPARRYAKRLLVAIGVGAISWYFAFYGSPV